MTSKRRSTLKIVLKWLEKYHAKGKIHEIPFDKVLEEVRKLNPQTHFSPAHLAWYKHHFLKEDLGILYNYDSTVVLK